MLQRRLVQLKGDNNNQSRNLQDVSPHKRKKLLVIIKNKPVQSNPLQELNDNSQDSKTYHLEEMYLTGNLQDAGQMIQRLSKKNIVKMNNFNKSKKNLFLIKNHLKRRINQ